MPLRKCGITGALLALGVILMALHFARSEWQQDRPRPNRSFPTPPPNGFLFVVTSTGDGDNMASGAVCDDGTGNCTLRAAIEVANANSGTDTIQFNIPGSDPGFNNSRWTINLTSALPDISSEMMISGPGADKLTVQRSSSAAQFRIFNVTVTGNFTLSGMTIANGVSQGIGGGIFNNNGATITLNQITLKNNFGGSGGGIYSQGGTINLTNSLVTGNTANTSGGGIFNNCFSGTCTVNVTNSTISGNTGAGGGIFNTAASGGTSIVNVTNSTISGNSGQLIGGGGIVSITSSGGAFSTTNITNSTIAGNFNNSNNLDGGGIYGDFTTINLTNSTVSGNSTTRMGGGIFSSTLATINVKNSLIAGNSAITTSTPDVSGAFVSQGNNVVGARDGSTGFTAMTDHTGTVAGPLDPKFDPAGLRNNGGVTATIALQSTSIAINMADPAAAPSRDQRGYVRSGAPDIGAFELGGTLPHSLGNISTRGFVQTGNNILIEGLIITGSGPKRLILRALGPTLGKPPFNVPGALQNPELELYDASNNLITSNDNWGSAANASAISASGFAPPNASESAILTSLNPGTYTAILRGVNNTTGVALVEGYDLDRTAGSEFGNISTRGFVQTGNNIMIAGIIVKGPDNQNVIIRGLGPTLGQSPFNLPNVLADPFLDLRNANGTSVATNDNWQATQSAAIQASGYAPPNPSESAILIMLAPGNYTALLSGVNHTTGNALVEVYSLN